ncbi:MAG: hypothetical protein K0Q79_576 [Flavipsychrobacter sp.]|jgi:hypothetical protein|nr:hypothetical protein [Flavipsychrobacter sp.]
MGEWIVIEKNPEIIDLALDIMSLGLTGIPDREPNVYRLESMDTGEQKVVKTLDEYELGAVIPNGIIS